MLYRGMDRAALDAAYDNGAAVGPVKRERYFADRKTRSEAFRARHSGRIDVPCGVGACQRLDVYPCGTQGAPTLAFIHGGYWQSNDKEPLSYVGEALLPAGFNLVLVEYTLAPAARLDAIVAEVRTAGWPSAASTTSSRSVSAISTISSGSIPPRPRVIARS
jgi:acetyl esterase/lipase